VSNPRAGVRATLVVVGFRHPGIVDAVRAALASAPPDSVDVRIMLNGRDPQVRAAVEARDFPATVIESEHNLGFSAAVNTLARDASTDYLVLLNDDAIARPAWLATLIATADELTDAGAVSSRLVFPDGRLQEAGGRINPNGHPEQVGHGHPDNDPALHVRGDVDYASAAALLVRRAAFEQIGGFDERFFPAYFEDVDLSLRLRRAGWRVVYEPDAVIEHLQGTSSSRLTADAAYAYNRQIFLRKFSFDGSQRIEGPDTSPISLEPDHSITTGGGVGQAWQAYAAWLAWLNEDTAEDLAASRTTVLNLEHEVRVLKGVSERLQAEIDAIHRSATWRAGRVLVAPAAAMRHARPR